MTGDRLGGWAVIAAMLLSVPVSGHAATQAKRRAAPSRALTLTAPLGSFTPAAADPRAAASFARAGIADSGFRFTPSASPGGRRAVTVAVRARRVAPGQASADAALLATPAMVTAISPTAYNLGASVGWKRFAVSGEVSRVDLGLMPGGRESADMTLSYGGRNWSTRVVVGAERVAGAGAALVGANEGYSVDLGGSYSLTRNLELSGGVRYRQQRERFDALPDLRRDSQAVYLGTAFKF